MVMSVKNFASALALLAGLVQGPVWADSTELKRVAANNCLSCHQVDAKRVGPSFRLIAERFSGNEGARDYLAQTIRSGGRGRWGAIPMPAQPQVSEHDATLIAEWILALNKSEQ